MRILHTSDWHLGQSFKDFDRTEEHEAFLDKLYWIAAEKRPDAIVVSGDIFDTPTPPVAAQELYNSKMISLSKLGIPIVVTAGNHDSASRLEVNGPLWRKFNLTVVGKVQYNDGTLCPDRNIVEIPGKGFVVALPYIYKNYYPDIPDRPDATVEERMEYFHNIFTMRVAQLNTAKLPVVMMAHLAVAENIAKTEYSERAANMEFCSVKSMGQGWDYLALGHIHRPSGKNNVRVRYCGSPIPLSFDETSPRSVSIVEIEQHGATPVIETVEIPMMRKMLTIPAEPKPLSDAIAELRQLNPDEDCYVRLNLLISDTVEGSASARASEALSGKQARYSGTTVSRIATENTADAQPQTQISVANINDDPMAIAKAYYLQKYNTEMSDELTQLLQSAIDETINQNRE